MFGDTWVEPAKLFDPVNETPPEDAIDVQFVVPTSLSLFADALAQTPQMAHLLPKLEDVYAQVLQLVVRDVQRSGGYVVHPGWGLRTPARLSLAVRSENSVPGASIMRIHAHVYVGRTATAIKDGQVCPVNIDELRRGVYSAWGSYARTLESATAEALGLVWKPLPGHHPADKEIVEPPFAQFVAEHPAPDAMPCPGMFGPRELIMADQQSRILIAESQVRVQAEQRWAG
jgi:hypothetical protein